MSTKSPIQTEFRTVREKLTNEEQLSLADRIVEAQLTLRKEEEAKSVAMKDLNSAVKRAHDLVNVLTDDYKLGSTERTVECQWELDFGEGIKRLVRLDTREIIEKKDLSVEEKQIPIRLGDSNAIENLVAEIPELPMMTCPKCSGEKQINIGAEQDNFVSCPDCSGSGQIVDEEKRKELLATALDHDQLSNEELVKQYDREIARLSALKDELDQDDRTRLSTLRNRRSVLRKRIARAEKKRKNTDE